MNIARLLSITAIAAASGVCHAAEAPSDTVPTRTHTLGEVVVTGTRVGTDARRLSQTVTTVSRAEIERTFQPSLLPVLTEQVPGLFATARGIMGYGVSGGASGSIAVRGLSGGSGRIMVLIDGQPQYMGLMGHPIADAYQSLVAERVEVLRSPASAIYGSNAMGGVVNIVTRKAPADGVYTDASIGYGSYNTLQSEAVNRIRHGRFASVIGGSYNRTDGHRRDMGFEQFGGYAKLGYDLSGRWHVSAEADVTHFNASQSGSVTVPLADADQEITRGASSLSVANDYGHTSGSLTIFYNWGNHWINDGYTPDPSDSNDPKDYRFDSHDYMAGASLHQSLKVTANGRLTAGADYLAFGGKARNAYVEGPRQGEKQTLVDKRMHEIAGYADYRQDIAGILTVDAGIRIDHHSEIGTEWIPQAGVMLRPTRNNEVRLSASKGFRYPTIREMYMFPPQNPDLEPERLWSYEAGYTHRLLSNRLCLGANIFYINGSNMIVAVPRQGATPLNMNTGTVRNAGLELQGSYAINATWNINANYSYLHMEHPVTGAPEHKAYASLTYAKDRWTASTGVQYVCGLYTATAPAQTEDFTLWNIRASFKVCKWLELWTRGENLLAQSYQINAGYPMPRATVMGGIKANI